MASTQTSCGHLLNCASAAQGGQCPVEPHKLQAPGATPGPATDRATKKETRTTTGYANRKSGGVESAVTLWVRLPPRSIRLRRMEQERSGEGDQVRKGDELNPVTCSPDPLLNSPIGAARQTGRRLACNQEIGVRFPGGPLLEVRRGTADGIDNDRRKYGR
jgi:hypothetical protein